MSGIRYLVLFLCALTATHCNDARRVGGNAPGAEPGTPAVQQDAVHSWAHFVLERPAPATRLFVESYFMRGLVAVSEVLSVPELTAADHALAAAALARAQAFADSLVRTQDARGYWKLGYNSGWVADMAAAVAVFSSLEPHMDPKHVTDYEACAAKFLRGLERDGLILDSGGVGLGWPLDEQAPPGARAWRSDTGWSDSEYLVATALAGIEVNAWLYHRTHAEPYRTRARKALDVTLARLKADGSFPTVGPQEGPLQVAFYVQEGWLAADAWLEDPQVAARICAASGNHVGALVAAQQPDGTWANGNPGDAARADGLLNFFLWHESRCTSDPRLPGAIGRSRRFLLHPRRWSDFGAVVAGEPNAELSEIRRALVGRPLAAAVRGRPVL